MEEGKKKHGGKNSEDKKDENVKDDTQEKQSSKKKGKGKKGKKGKGRGKKSNREASEKDKTALKEFLDHLKGTRRLMVRTFSFSSLHCLPPDFQDISEPDQNLPIIHLKYCVCLCVFIVLVDLDAQKRRNTVHPAERGEREATLQPRHKEGHRGHHCG